MKEADFLNTQFPGAAHLLHTLRASNKEFDQLCADYHEVFCELAQAPQSVNQTQARYIADLAESVSDLRNSIEKQLRTQERKNE